MQLIAGIADNLEVKKLVYLYLINYAKSNPDMTLMAVNAFVKDTANINPLVRALAIRTMGCIRVERITEHLSTPLRKALSDEDPYVRKTAAMCVAKLYDIDPSLTREQGFLEILLDLTSDPVPIVVANAVAALMEIQDTTTRDVFSINTATLTRLLAALKDCSEWGQVVILDALSTYVPSDEREAETVIERIAPWLAHQNPAVVLNSVKTIVLMMESIKTAETIAALCRKLGPPLVTLAQSSHPEIQYVALRNISLIVQRFPGLLSSKVRVFFCKYNEPIYVKMEKLEVLVRLANASNVDSVLAELREYAQEVDVEYVRRSVRTIGRLAIKLDKAADKCIKVLLQLIKDKTPGGGGSGGAAAAASSGGGGGGGGGGDQNYLVQEAVVVIKDIFRRYPNHYEGVIGVLCEHLEALDEPEAKAALVWIIGEYAERIENAVELLEEFLESFLEETAQVQLALLTAVVKCYLKVPDDAEEAVQSVLQKATEDSDNPDLRDRGYIYWRLLAADPDAARAVVLAEKPQITDDTNAVPASMLTDMLAQISTLASVYHKSPDAFVRRVRKPGEYGDEEEDEEEDDDEEEDGEAGEEEQAEEAAAAAASAAAGAGEDDEDIFGLGAITGAAATAAAPHTPAAAAPAPAEDLGDLFGAPAPAAAATARSSSNSADPAMAAPVHASAGGVDFSAVVARDPSAGTPRLHIAVNNGLPGGTPISAVAVRINVNPFGLAPETLVATFSTPVLAGSRGAASVRLVFDASKVNADKDPASLQLALREESTKASVKTTTALSYGALLNASPALERSAYLGQFGSCEASEVAETVRDLPTGEPEAIKIKLGAAGINFVAQRTAGDKVMLYYSAHGAGGSGFGTETIFVECTHKSGVNAIKLCVRATAEFAAEAAHTAAKAAICA